MKIKQYGFRKYNFEIKLKSGVNASDLSGMKYTLAILITSVIFCLTACGGDDAENRSFFSKWERQDKSFSLDLTGVEMSTITPIVFQLNDGGTCSCNAFIAGEIDEGLASVTACNFTPAPEGSDDPGCEFLENSGQPYSFKVSGDTMELCESEGVCADYAPGL